MNKIALGAVGHFSLAVRDPEAIEHLSFHVGGIDALRAALDVLKKNGVEVEDPGDEIGPEAPGSPNT